MKEKGRRKDYNREKETGKKSQLGKSGGNQRVKDKQEPYEQKKEEGLC